MELEPKKQKIEDSKEENDESSFLNLFDLNIIQQILIQLVNSHTFYEDIKDCYSDCTSFSLTSKLLNSISKQTQFSIKIFQNQKMENINYNIYLKLNYILQQKEIKDQTFNSKEEVLNYILIYVSENGIYNLIQTLILNGANPNYHELKCNFTPLCHSCSQGHYKTTKLLILNNADINCKEYGTLLHLACRTNNCKLVKYLLKQGIDVNSTDFSEETPLHYACCFGNLKIVKYLIRSGCDVDPYSGVLHKACSSGNLDLVKYLAENKELCVYMDPFCTDREGKSALFNAVDSENTDLIDYLLSLGLNINHKSYVSSNSETPLYFACRNCTSEITKHLILKGKIVLHELLNLEN